MSSHPPAPGSQILVAFPNNSDVGVMVGVLPDVTRNASVPSNPAAFVDSESDTIGPTLDPSVKKTQDKNTTRNITGRGNRHIRYTKNESWRINRRSSFNSNKAHSSSY